MAAVYVIEESDTFLLVEDNHVVNGGWDLLKDSDGMFIPDRRPFHPDYRGKRVHCVMGDVSIEEDFNEVLNRARDMWTMPLFDRPGKVYDNQL